MTKQYLYDFTFDELKEALKPLNAPRFRAEQIFKALHQGVAVAEITNIPKDLRAWLAENFNCNLPEIVTVQTSRDGTKKYLLAYEHPENTENGVKTGENTSKDLIECVLLNQN